MNNYNKLKISFVKNVIIFTYLNYFLFKLRSMKSKNLNQTLAHMNKKSSFSDVKYVLHIKL